MGRFLTDFTGGEASKAMLEGLTSLIRSKLRERILETIEPDLEKAIDGALEALQASIHTYREAMHMRDVVRIIIERKDRPAGAVGTVRSGK